jgi:hypothetical protein
MTIPEVTRIPTEQLQQYQQAYCSKIYADIDDFVFTERLAAFVEPPIFYDRSRLFAPSTKHSNITRNIHEYDDPHYPWAMAKVPIVAGDRIELAPALVLGRDLVLNTPLAPLVYYWHDLNDKLQASVRDLRNRGYYVVQYQGDSTAWLREDHFVSFEDSVILPVGGWIGRVQRVGGASHDIGEMDSRVTANCKLRILPANSNNATAEDVQQQQEEKSQNPFALGNAGIVLELVATRDIAVGERLRINMPPGGTFLERLALYNEMERSGQIYTLTDHHYQQDSHHRDEMASHMMGIRDEL